jgi:chromosome partitioning protein
LRNGGTEWDQTNAAWKKTPWKDSIQIPQGKPNFLGYVMQQHNIRNNADGMTQGWKIFGDRLESAIQKFIVDRLLPLGQVKVSNSYALGKIPNLHSLIPYSLEARKPVFKCSGSDGLRGEHIGRARDSKKLFNSVTRAIQSL